MGGRGRADGWSRWVEREPAPEGYTVITPATVRTGEAYPFFEATGRRWSLVSVPLGEAVTVLPRHTLGMDSPTLVWFSDNDRKELYVDGMNTEAYCQATGLSFSLHKGAAVLSKRMSRILRSYRTWEWFDTDRVQIGYLDQTPEEAKVWDGAGLMDRRLLAKMPVPDGLDGSQARAWRRRLLREGRVEFTVQHAGGQDKGHAMVVDRLRDAAGKRVDFLLPRDTKREVTLSDGVFVGINPVHGKDDLRVDIQSFINLNEFWGREQAIDGAQAELRHFEAAVAENRLEDIGLHLGGREAGHGEAWPLQAFWEAGGDIRWSPHLIKAVFDQHLRRLEASAHDKVRLPQPGGRYYVMPAGVGQRGGLTVAVGRGMVQIDATHATAWVNDEDWLSLSGQRTEDYGDGIASILGGADNDDGLWLSPFTDAQDGAKKFLIWRSPNQVGEYVVLMPTDTSHIPLWQGGEVWPARDSAWLPTRADRQQVQYLGMVDHERTGGMGQGESYTPEAMARVQAVLEKNQGGLELYCNATMRHVAMYGGLPAVAPARLEDVVDSKKTGADVSAVKQWCYDDTRAALARGDRIPRRLLGRLARERGRAEGTLEPPPVTTTEGDYHWLDIFDLAWKGHIKQVQAVRDRFMAEARLPEALLQSVEHDPEALAAGSRFNQLYAATVKRLQREEFGVSQREMMVEVQREVELQMNRYTAETRRALLIQWEFDREWRRLSGKRGNGGMGMADYDAAVAQASATVARLSDKAVAVEVQTRLTQQAVRQLEKVQKRGISSEALEEVRQTMERYLSQWSDERQRAVLRGAMVSVMVNERRKPGGDANGVWLMGAVQADGTRVAGIANNTIAALGEIGVMGLELSDIVMAALAEINPEK
jgi:hypothetical protein